MKPDYGIDAPGVIRNLLLVCVAGLALWATIAAHLWSGVVAIGPVRLALRNMALFPAIGCGAMAIWMLWDSKVGKVRERGVDVGDGAVRVSARRRAVPDAVVVMSKGSGRERRRARTRSRCE